MSLPTAAVGKPAPEQMVFGRPLRPRIPAWVSIAPMMDKTDRHFRRFLRLLTKRALLYTEMITAEAIVFGDRDKLLAFDVVEHPIALQLGGDNPQQLAEAVRIASDYGYDEFNLNVGCPSDRVQFRNFGACLMADPPLVADCLGAMAGATAKPVTVKHRVGIRGFGHVQESWDEMAAFVGTVAAAGCDGFTIHARIAILEGLSPRDNRQVPPLRYEDVWRLKVAYPELPLEINGHIGSWDKAEAQLEHLDAVMIGRPSYENPWLLADCDAFCAHMDNRYGRAYGVRQASPATPSAEPFSPSTNLRYNERVQVVLDHVRYLDDICAATGYNPRSLVWPIIDMFAGFKGARKYRQILSQPMGMQQSLYQTTLKALESLVVPQAL